MSSWNILMVIIASGLYNNSPQDKKILLYGILNKNDYDKGDKLRIATLNRKERM